MEVPKAGMFSGKYQSKLIGDENKISRSKYQREFDSLVSDELNKLDPDMRTNLL